VRSAVDYLAGRSVFSDLVIASLKKQRGPSSTLYELKTTLRGHSTTVKKSGGVAVKTPALPVQAIVQDKDTWIEGAFKFSLDRSE
jgi:hypothetical protein